MAVVVVLSGCGPGGLTNRSDADRNPYCLKARKAVEQRDFETAVKLYRQALMVNPKLADAHLEIGMLYEDKQKDPISAIYHYRRCLEVESRASKREMAQDFIERARVSLLTSLPQSTMLDADALARVQSEKTALVHENELLRARVAELEQDLAENAAAEILRAEAALPPPPPVAPWGSPPVGTAEPPPVTQPVETGHASARTHLVQKGDTLYSLSLRYYGSRSDWQKIYQANRHTMTSKDQLKIGQQLVIP